MPGGPRITFVWRWLGIMMLDFGCSVIGLSVQNSVCVALKQWFQKFGAGLFLLCIKTTSHYSNSSRQTFELSIKFIKNNVDYQQHDVSTLPSMRRRRKAAL